MPEKGETAATLLLIQVARVLRDSSENTDTLRDLFDTRVLPLLKAQGALTPTEREIALRLYDNLVSFLDEPKLP